MPLLLPPEGAAAELNGRRRIASKTYRTATPGRLIWQGSTGVVHVPSSYEAWKSGKSLWQDADTEFHTVRGKPAIGAAWYALDIDPSTMTIRGDWIDGGLGELRLAALGGAPWSAPPEMSVETIGASVWFRNVALDLDLEVRCAADTFEVFKHLKSPAAPHQLDWAVRNRVVDLHVPAQTLTRGRDASRLFTEILHAVGEPKLSEGVAEFSFRELITGKTRAERNSKEGYPRDGQYPLAIDLTFGPTDLTAPNDGNDDVTEGGTWFGAGASWYCGADALNQTAGLRWTGLTVERNNTINSATVQFAVEFVDGGGVSAAAAFGVDLDTAPAWSNTNRPSNTGVILRTSSSEAFTVTTTGSKTITVTDEVQEIVNRGGWDEDTLAFVLDATAGLVFSARAADAGSGDLPTLTIDFDTGVPTYDQTGFRFFNVGDELPHFDSGSLPTITSVTGTSDNSDGTTVTANYPATVAPGDLLIWVVAKDDDAGPIVDTTGGLTPIAEGNGGSGTDGVRLGVWYEIADGDEDSATRVFTSDSEMWRVACLRILAGAFDPVTPIGAVAAMTGASSGTTADTAAFVSPRAGSLVIACGAVDVDPMDATFSPAGWTDVDDVDVGDVTGWVARRDAATTQGETIAAASFGINTNDAWAAVAFTVNAPLVADGRTPLEAVNTPLEIAVDTPFGVQIRVLNSGGIGADDFVLLGSINGGALFVIDGSSPVFLPGTADYAQGDPVPEYIGGTGTYQAGEAMDTSAQVTLGAFLAGATEFHATLEGDAAQLEDGDELELYIALDDGSETALDSYSQVATVTFTEGGGGASIVPLLMSNFRRRA